VKANLSYHQIFYEMSVFTNKNPQVCNGKSEKSSTWKGIVLQQFKSCVKQIREILFKST